ncbi:ABC transporter permease [Propylenella binzhouense]|uniref:ABC transporter permease n=1 Tax=Propylenella binzhouense TaxID=2555902 RepID=A0A964T7W1_9HYPH|nr:ABC transporter permease [Propylenella binzhouense]MYZ48987.1 ABC transporter permease [Propylenella binzhouense]
MSLGGYLLKRVFYSIPLMLGAITIIFALIHAAPGEPTDYIIGDASVSQEFIDRLRAEMGLDRPLWVQLGKYVLEVMSGNFGFSYVRNTPVIALILDRLPATLLLMVTQYVVSVALGIYLGVISARRPNSLLDRGITVFSLAAFAIPLFWLGQMLILTVAYQLDWFPIQGMVNIRQGYTGFAHVLDVAHHLFLPALTLALPNIALILRLTRSSMIEVIGQEYIKVARAKGLSERSVLFKHALRNALIPVVTVVSLNLPTLIAGAVLTETVFAWPGLGRLTFDAIHARDYPLLMGMFIFISLVVILGNLIADLLYALLDPRIRYQ